jgi:ribonuclease HII
LPHFEIERRHLEAGKRLIAGVDEVGRGALCGPVIAAAVLLPSAWISGRRPKWVRRIDDSKRLTAAARVSLAREIRHAAVCGLGMAGPSEIDAINILRASHEAMRRAVGALSVLPEVLLVDGRPVDGLPVMHEAVIKGDSLSVSIAAASILAKVCRDRIMSFAARRYPGYGMEHHMGYGTQGHYEALAQFGPTPFHRMSFNLQYQLKLFEKT